MLRNGRPIYTEGRLLKEIKCYDLLDELKIEYQTLDHPPADTMEVCEMRAEELGARICKNLVLCNRQKTCFYLLLMPGDKQFKTRDLSAQIESSRLSFAPSEDMERLLCVTPGSANILSLMNDSENEVTLLIDEDVLKEEYFACHPMINTSSVKFKTVDLVDKVLPFLKHNYKKVTL